VRPIRGLVKAPAPTIRGAVTPPFVARRSMMCAANTEGEIFFFGGVGAGLTESILDVSHDMWIFYTRDGEWQRVPQSEPWPSPRRCAGFTAIGLELLLWGGSGIEQGEGGDVRYNFLNDLWVFDRSESRWQRLEASDVSSRENLERPGPRYTPNLHLLNDEIFLFGGYTEDAVGKRKLNDVWIRKESTWYEIPFSGPAGFSEGSGWPGVRYGSQSSTDGTSVYIFGGFSDEGDHNDMWVYKDGRFELIHGDSDSPAVPLPRYCAAFDFYDGGLYLFGGRSRRNPKANYSDLWRFDFTERTWTVLQDHGTTDDRGMATPGYHAKSSVAVVEDGWYLWGGEGPHGHVSDFWRYSFTDRRWNLICPQRDDDPIFW